MPALLRLAGWSAIAAGTAHLLQFLELGIGPALDESAFPTPSESAGNYWFGLVGAGTFTLIALAYLLFFSAATTVVWLDTTPTGAVWRRAMQSAAVIGIGGWILAGMNNIARRGFNARGIAEITSDDAIARAALQSTYVFQTAATAAMVVMFGAWWCAFAIRGLRTRTLGWPTAITVLVLAGLLPVLGWAADLGGVPSIILAFFVVGPVLLVKARRAQRVGAPAPETVAR